MEQTIDTVSAYLWSDGREYEDKRVELEIKPNETDHHEVVLSTFIDGQGAMHQIVLTRDHALQVAAKLIEAAVNG